MNQKTAKLIKSYAFKVGAKARQVKRDWLALARQQKAKRRASMKDAVK